MARANQDPVTLLETDDQRVEIIQVKRGYTFRVVGVGSDSEDAAPAMTAAEWCKVAIELLLKCPDAKDRIGLVSATTSDLTVRGKTLGRRGAWKAWFTEVGNDSNGDTLLEWSTSRPLDLIEIAAVFKAVIKQLSDMEHSE